MIYIKDYRSLGSYAGREENSFERQLASLVGRPVTIFVEGGKSFTGVLIEVLDDRVRLVTSLPSAPLPRGCPCGKKCSRFGSATTVLIRSITAVSSNFV